MKGGDRDLNRSFDAVSMPCAIVAQTVMHTLHGDLKYLTKMQEVRYARDERY